MLELEKAHFMTRIQLRTFRVVWAISSMMAISGAAHAGAIEVYVDALHEGEFARADAPAAPGAVYRGIQDAAGACAVARDKGRWAEGGIIIHVRQTAGLFAEPVRLEAGHSGAPGGPLTIRGMTDAPPAPGGHVISAPGQPSPFTRAEDESVLSRLPETARGNVVKVDLFSLDFSQEELGKLSRRGFGRGVQRAQMELLANGEVMPLAEWPNEDWARIEAAPQGQDGGMFTVANRDRLARWTTAEDLWVHGYWTWDWADSYERVERLEPETGAIYTAPPHGAYGYKQGQRWRALNLLEELDRPGEYYIHRGSGTLYWWPPAPIEALTVAVSTGESAFIIENASDIVIEDFLIEGLRGTGIVIRDSRDVSVRGCLFRSLGNRAVAVNAGSDVLIAGCDITGTGDGGIVLSGGNRMTLEPGRHAAVNNHIHDYSRWRRTYCPAVQVSGAGHRVAHNKIHNAPHNGIQLGGNEHRVEYNELFDLCKDTGDVGAFYTGRDWTARGVLIQHNYFHDLRGPYTHGAMGVYLDDAASGFNVRGNVFERASRAMFIGGGRDNLVANNLFIDCAPSVHIDARGLGWAKEYIAEGGSWNMYEKLRAVRHTEPPYSERYPELAAILDNQPAHPLGNVVRHNVSIGGDWLDLQNVQRSWVQFERNEIRLKQAALQRHEGIPYLDKGARPEWFEALPVAQIGLKDDATRPSKTLMTAPKDKWSEWYRPADNPVFTAAFGNNHDSMLFVEDGLEYPYRLIISHDREAAHLWRAKQFSWSSDDWELVSDRYQIGEHYEYDDGVKVDGTYYIYEGGKVYTWTGALEEGSGKWEQAGAFPSAQCDDVGVYYEDGVFHLFGEYGNFPHGPDGVSLSHFVSETGLGAWRLINDKAVDPNPDGGDTYGVGDPAIAKIGGWYYLFCDRETKDLPYEVVSWRSPSLYKPFEYVGQALVPRRDEVDDWDNYRIQDADIAYIPALHRYVMTCNMLDRDGNPGGSMPQVRGGGTRVIGMFYSTHAASGR